MKKKNLLERKLSLSIRQQLPLGMLLSNEIEPGKTQDRLARCKFHKSEKYSCYAFHKPISKMIRENGEELSQQLN